MDLRLVTDPDAFFADRSENPALTVPALVVCVAALTNVASSVVLLWTATSGLSGRMTGVIGVGLLLGTLGGAVGVFAIWFLGAAVFYLITSFWDASGTFGETFRLTGWGFLPNIVGGLIGTVGISIAVRGTAPPSGPKAVVTYITAVRTDPILTVTGLLAVVFLLWQALLWTFAVRHARSVSTGRAAVAVGVPVSLLMIRSLLSAV
jgi:hypothetical protein